MSDVEISETLGIPYGTVHYYRDDARERKKKYNRAPGVRERVREYMRKYRQKRNREWREFISLISGGSENAVREASNVYLGILKCLWEYRNCYAVRHRDLMEELGIEENKNLVRKLYKLRCEGFVGYEEKRYFLTEKGMKICEKLFGKLFISGKNKEL